MVYTIAMETMNRFHYCYGDVEWFTLLLWRQGMVFTTAMEIMNRFQYCYGDEEWFSKPYMIFISHYNSISV